MEKIMFFFLFIVLFPSFLIPADSNRSQEKKPLETDINEEELLEDLEATFPHLMKKEEIPGMSIAVFTNSMSVQ